MNLHSLHNPAPQKERKRVGRGNGNNWGRTCGRGEKGQLSRTGARHRPHFEGGQITLLRRLPKRGFIHDTHTTYAVVNLRDLELHFADGDVIETSLLQEKGLVKKEMDGVKILGDGAFSRKVTVKAKAFSASAKAKIEAAGGTCELI